MRILAIDTSTEICSVALWDRGNIYAYSINCITKHSQHILPLINVILNQKNISLKEINALAFNRGPGSFTGIRIGIGVMQGLALGINIPMIKISTFAIIAQGVWRKTGATKILIIIDAYMDKVYLAKYTRNEHGIWHGEKTETILKINTVVQQLKKLSSKWIIVRSKWKTQAKIMNNSILNLTVNSNNIFLPKAEDMLPIAYYLLSNSDNITPIEDTGPIYLNDETI